MSDNYEDEVASPVPAPAKKAPAPPLHPYREMIKTAITELKERKGSSKYAILKYIMANFEVGTNEAQVNRILKRALRMGVNAGTLRQVTGTGAGGKFKLGEKALKPKKKSKKITQTFVIFTEVKKTPKKPTKAKKTPKKKAAEGKKTTKKAAEAKKTPKKKAAEVKKTPKKAAEKKTTKKAAEAKKPPKKKAADAKKTPKKAAEAKKTPKKRVKSVEKVKKSPTKVAKKPAKKVMKSPKKATKSSQ